MFRWTLSVFFILLVTSAAFADSFLPPCPYVVKSADGTKHFVVLTSPKEDECRGRSESDAANAKELRKKYGSSGLYEDGDPTKQLWAIQKDWWLGRVHVANDGSHIVHMGVLGRSLSSTAFTIYKNGQTVRTYEIGEFLKDESAANYSTSMIHWSTNTFLNDRNSTFNVETNDNIRYSIDLSTGEIVSQDPKPSSVRADETSPSNPASDSPTKVCFGFFVIALGFIGLIVRKS